MDDASARRVVVSAREVWKVYQMGSVETQALRDGQIEHLARRGELNTTVGTMDGQTVS